MLQTLTVLRTHVASCFASFGYHCCVVRVPAGDNCVCTPRIHLDYVPFHHQQLPSALLLHLQGHPFRGATDYNHSYLPHHVLERGRSVGPRILGCLGVDRLCVALLDRGFPVQPVRRAPEAHSCNWHSQAGMSTGPCPPCKCGTRGRLGIGSSLVNILLDGIITCSPRTLRLPAPPHPAAKRLPARLCSSGKTHSPPTQKPEPPQP